MRDEDLRWDEVEQLIQEATDAVLKGLQPRLDQVQKKLAEYKARNGELEALLEARSEPRRRPASHSHDTDYPEPVIVLDLNGTLTPWNGYPMTEAEPFPKVKKWLDHFAARGCCLHLATAGLWPEVIASPDIFRARRHQVQNFMVRHALPIQWIGPKVGADRYYDDRMISVPPKPDWDIVGARIEENLNKRFRLVNGIWQRIPKKPLGEKIRKFPDIAEVPGDRHRGYSTPILDVDMHRTLTQASGSTVTHELNPDVVDLVRKIYEAKFIIHISCAGWNPATHDNGEWQGRLAAMRYQLLEAGVPFDQFVSKDHGDVFVDDKGQPYIDAKKDYPVILKALQARINHPSADIDNYGDEHRPTAGSMGPKEA